MVLWEITLATAYFLGLRRTYRLALKIQRKVISPKYPRFRQFAQRRTRAAFDVALKVYRNIQERDIEVGQNLGNRILKCLDRMKPSAEIRGKPSQVGSVKTNASKQVTSSSHQTSPTDSKRNGTRSGVQESDKHFFSSTRGGFPTIMHTMVQPNRQGGINTQYRHLSFYCPKAFRMNYGGFGNAGVIRRDIMQWMLQNQSS